MASFVVWVGSGCQREARDIEVKTQNTRAVNERPGFGNGSVHGPLPAAPSQGINRSG